MGNSFVCGALRARAVVTFSDCVPDERFKLTVARIPSEYFEDSADDGKLNGLWLSVQYSLD
jgi:hypothetical protein